MRKVILVEDEELISTMIRINLEQEGLAVESFGDAEAMLTHVAGHPGSFDVVLLDIMLPGIQGDAALLELRRLGVDAPVMMLTAKSDVDTRVEALNLGADDYLAKPFNVRELVARVNALLRRGQNNGAATKE
jgi:DNA-binding response OmpR family regulator